MRRPNIYYTYFDTCILLPKMQVFTGGYFIYMIPVFKIPFEFNHN